MLILFGIPHDFRNFISPEKTGSSKHDDFVIVPIQFVLYTVGLEVFDIIACFVRTATALTVIPLQMMHV